MPIENDLDKVLIIGSGPTLIGSVAETDLLVTDAITAMTEDGVQVVLVDPNPATISTDKRPGVTVYLEPMTLDFLKRIIRMEEPDAIMTAFGSTTGLQAARALVKDGILRQMGIKLLTLNEEALAMDDRAKRTTFLNKIGVSGKQSFKLTATIAHEKRTKERLTFPLTIKKSVRAIEKAASFADLPTLIDYFTEEQKSDDFSWHDYCLEEDLSTWNRVIINLIRDHDGNCVFINFADSLESCAVNSGDSAMVIPALTLNNDQIQDLRAITKKIATNLDLVGVLNLEFAVRHHGTQIETKVLGIKARLTKSAFWGQRTDLYSIGYVVSKVALGYRLNEITDPLSGLNAAIEPVQDKIAIKMPYWSLSESGSNHYRIAGRMQASGEVMGLGRNFESAFIKAGTSTTNLNLVATTFAEELGKSHEEIASDLEQPDELHLIILLAAIAQGFTYQELQNIVHLHPVYYQKLQAIVNVMLQLMQPLVLTDELLVQAKNMGFGNTFIAQLHQCDVDIIDSRLANMKCQPAFLEVDGSAGIYRPEVQVFYSAYNVEDEATPLAAEKKILLIGMLPLQVSVTSEFDYMISHAITALHKNDYAVILLSNNDESVASRYQDVDRVYFEPITIENIVAVAKKEGISDVMLQFSGKKISDLSTQLIAHGLNVIGYDGKDPQLAIKQLLQKPLADVQQNSALVTADKQELADFIKKNGFPILVGGISRGIKQKSAVVYDVPAIQKYLTENQVEQITVSHFIEGNKYEITAISDGVNVTIPGIIEHLEQTGSHASDSIAVFKPQNLSLRGRDKLIDVTTKLIRQLGMRGIFTLHFLNVDQELYLLQIKPYAGHNVAFLSKALDKDITTCAVEALIGKSLTESGCTTGLWPASDYIHVKMPVFSYINYDSGNTFDSKMKSSGSVMGRDTELAKALYKGYEASNLPIPSYGTIFISVRDEDKPKVTELAKRFNRLGFKIVATEGTANIFAEAGVTTGIVNKLHHEPHNLLDKIQQHKIVMVINVTNLSDAASEDAIRIRDQALNAHVPVFSSIETAELILSVLESLALTTQPI